MLFRFTPVDRQVASNLPSLGGCEEFPLCQFRSSFDVLALCTNFTNPARIGEMTSLHDGQWHSLCFSVSSSLLQPLHFFSSDQPMSTLVFCHPFLPIDHPSNRPSKLGFLTTSFSHPVGSHRRLSFEHQSVPLWRLDAQVSHITAPAGRLTCRVCTSRKLLPPRFLHPHTLRAEEHNHGGKFLLNLKIFHFHENRERDRLLLACSCGHLPPQLQPFCGRDANGLNSLHSRRDQAHPQQLPHTSPQSTLDVSTLVAGPALSVFFLISIPGTSPPDS